MKKMILTIVFLALFCFVVFGDDPQEIDFLLFLPNSGNSFVNEEAAAVQLDNVARYLRSRELISSQIYVYGYAADVDNGVDSADLSRDRAVFVIDELQRRGISSNLFAVPVGYGAVDLWGNNVEEDDRSPNRRVRILLEDIILTPDVVQPTEPEYEPEPEIVISGIEQIEYDEKPIQRESVKDESSSKFPLWIFLLLPLLLLLLLLILSKRRKKETSVSQEAPSPQETVPLPPQQQETQPASRETAPPQQETPPAPPPSPQEEAPLQPPPPQKAVEPIAAPVAPGEKVKVLEEEEIRNYAYGLYEKRNGQHGYNEEDWYQAIRELTDYYTAQGYKVVMYWEA